MKTLNININLATVFFGILLVLILVALLGSRLTASIPANAKPIVTAIDQSTQVDAPGQRPVTQETSLTDNPGAHLFESQSELPDFAAIHDVGQKKQAFFDYLLPMIRQSNENIGKTRQILTRYQELLLNDRMLDSAQSSFINRLASQYRVRSTHTQQQKIEALLIRVDVVPASLVLAQAANESGWGTSRFAREANNLFGIWCFTPGCGLTPSSRDDGLSHEVARYESVQDSISAYIYTINSHPAYRTLRGLRVQTRLYQPELEQALAAEFQPDQTTLIGVNCRGSVLAEGLIHYSARGVEYVRDIQQLIRVNKLHEYTLQANFPCLTLEPVPGQV